LEKKPDQRPLNADMVNRALGSIQEKVEAQQSAGVEAARGRMIDRPRGVRHADEEDKEAARSLRTGKSKAKRKRKTTPFYGKLWFQAVGIVAVLGFLVGVLYLVLRPASPETLYAQAKKLMDSTDLDKHEEAYNGPIKDYLRIYASREGDETARVLAWKKQSEVEQSEEALDKLLHARFKRDPASDVERDAVKAAKAEEDGDLEEAMRLWQEMTKKYGPTSGHEDWGIVAANHLAVVTAVPEQEKTFLAMFKEFRATGREPALDGMAKKAYTGLRYEHLADLYGGQSDLPMAYNRFDEMKTECANDRELHFWKVFAAWKCKALKSRLPVKEEPHARKTLVQEAVEAAQMGEDAAPLDARAIALNVVALYSDDSELKSLVDKARQVVDDMKTKVR
jgi:hypothetical protein